MNIFKVGDKITRVLNDSGSLKTTTYEVLKPDRLEGNSCISLNVKIIKSNMLELIDCIGKNFMFPVYQFNEEGIERRGEGEIDVCVLGDDEEKIHKGMSFLLSSTNRIKAERYRYDISHRGRQGFTNYIK